MTSSQKLDGSRALQRLLADDDWQQDTTGSLVSSALELCAKAGAPIGDALDYLEIDDATAWTEYFGSRYATIQAASLLGSIKTEKKATASRENGKKGGRPRKNKRPSDPKL